MMPRSASGSRRCSPPTTGPAGSWSRDSRRMSETTAPETEEAPAASVPETRPPSHLVTGEHTIGRHDRHDRRARPGRPPRGFVAGQVIAGRYTLHEVLGEGGMGTVYRADQTEPVKRQVALKLIKVGMDSRAVLARFDAERQALALMDHPNIARVFDGGTTAAGQPFFVMELVNGVPITEYCDRQRLSVRARLELFVAVCQAVQHAHQKGIIHRDLKPSNVMVTEVDGRPTPKVIDFGVAKATEFKLTDQSFADSGAIVGTPAYMSPEQADPSSMDIDTRTDVYALGVILYELLAGSPPIDAKQFKRGAILEMLRMVREVDPPRPSTKVSTAEALPNIAASRDIEPAQLKRALRGDLDWIVMKALEKDRDAALRDGERVRGRRPSAPGVRAGAGCPAEPGLPAAEVRAEAPRRGGRRQPGRRGARGWHRGDNLGLDPCRIGTGRRSQAGQRERAEVERRQGTRCGRKSCRCPRRRTQVPARHQRIPVGQRRLRRSQSGPGCRTPGQRAPGAARLGMAIPEAADARRLVHPLWPHELGECVSFSRGWHADRHRQLMTVRRRCGTRGQGCPSSN